MIFFPNGALEHCLCIGGWPIDILCGLIVIGIVPDHSAKEGAFSFHHEDRCDHGRHRVITGPLTEFPILDLFLYVK